MQKRTSKRESFEQHGLHIENVVEPLRSKCYVQTMSELVPFEDVRDLFYEVTRGYESVFKLIYTIIYTRKLG